MFHLPRLRVGDNFNWSLIRLKITHSKAHEAKHATRLFAILEKCCVWLVFPVRKTYPRRRPPMIRLMAGADSSSANAGRFETRAKAGDSPASWEESTSSAALS